MTDSYHILAVVGFAIASFSLPASVFTLVQVWERTMLSLVDKSLLIAILIGTGLAVFYVGFRVSVLMGDPA